jgi:hypothetical protein
MLDVEQAQRDKDPRDTYSQVGWSQLWARNVCNAIADLFFCKYYFGQKVNATKCYHHFVGRESNATTAMYMAEHVVTSILKEGRSRYGENLSPETRSFATGCVDRLWSRVLQMKRDAAQEAGAPGTALVLANFYDTEAAANKALLPKLKLANKGKDVNTHAYRQGQEFGNSISLAPQVGATKSKHKALK